MNNDIRNYYPLLSKYPKILSKLIYGNESPENITKVILKHIEIHYDPRYDIHEFVSSIKKIVPFILISDNRKWLDEELEFEFACFANEIANGDIRYYNHKGKFSVEALFICVSYLCYSNNPVNTGIMASFERIGEYALRSDDEKILILLYAATYDLIIVHLWDSLLESTFSHIAISIAMNLPSLAKSAITMKLMPEKNQMEFFRSVPDKKQYQRYKKRLKKDVPQYITEDEYKKIETEYDNLFLWLDSLKEKGIMKEKETL